jgi:hypothetical protein
MRYAALIAIVVGASAPAAFAPTAFAQGVEPPRFEALEQQQRDLNQQRLDDFDRQRANEYAKPIPPGQPALGEADRATALQQIERDRQQFLLERDVERQAQQREREIARLTETNRIILPNASEVIDNPKALNLPAAPQGQYYARLNGHYVIVDGATNRPIKSFDLSPDEGGSTIPGTTQPRPIQPQEYYQQLPKQPGLPDETVPPDSKRVIKDPAGRFLGKAPPDSYYADFDGAIYLIDARSQKAIALVRAKEKPAPQKASKPAEKPGKAEAGKTN